LKVNLDHQNAALGKRPIQHLKLLDLHFEASGLKRLPVRWLVPLDLLHLDVDDACEEAEGGKVEVNSGPLSAVDQVPQREFSRVAD